MVRSSASGREPKALDKHVGARLRSAREAISETAETIAMVMGVSIEAYEKIEHGEQRPTAEALHLASLFLNVRISYFFVDFLPAHAPASSADVDDPPKPTEKKRRGDG